MLHQEVLASERASVGSQHPYTFLSMYNLGRLLEDQGKLRKAETLFSEALTGSWRVLGRTHTTTQLAYNALVHVLTAQGKARDAKDVKAQYGGCK